MDMDVAATWLAGSILFGLSLIVLTITLLVINNLLSKYWKPVQWSALIPDHLGVSYKFMDQTVEPVKEDPKAKK